MLLVPQCAPRNPLFFIPYRICWSRWEELYIYQAYDSNFFRVGECLLFFHKLAYLISKTTRKLCLLEVIWWVFTHFICSLVLTQLRVVSKMLMCACESRSVIAYSHKSRPSVCNQVIGGTALKYFTTEGIVEVCLAKQAVIVVLCYFFRVSSLGLEFERSVASWRSWAFFASQSSSVVAVKQWQRRKCC